MVVALTYLRPVGLSVAVRRVRVVRSSVRSLMSIVAQSTVPQPPASRQPPSRGARSGSSHSQRPAPLCCVRPLRAARGVRRCIIAALQPEGKCVQLRAPPVELQCVLAALVLPSEGAHFSPTPARRLLAPPAPACLRISPGHRPSTPVHTKPDVRSSVVDLERSKSVLDGSCVKYSASGSMPVVCEDWVPWCHSTDIFNGLKTAIAALTDEMQRRRTNTRVVLCQSFVLQMPIIAFLYMAIAH